MRARPPAKPQAPPTAVPVRRPRSPGWHLLSLGWTQGQRVNITLKPPMGSLSLQPVLTLTLGLGLPFQGHLRLGHLDSFKAFAGTRHRMTSWRYEQLPCVRALCTRGAFHTAGTGAPNSEVTATVTRQARSGTGCPPAGELCCHTPRASLPGHGDRRPHQRTLSKATHTAGPPPLTTGGTLCGPEVP